MWSRWFRQWLLRRFFSDDAFKIDGLTPYQIDCLRGSHAALIEVVEEEGFHALGEQFRRYAAAEGIQLPFRRSGPPAYQLPGFKGWYGDAATPPADPGPRERP